MRGTPESPLERVNLSQMDRLRRLTKDASGGGRKGGVPHSEKA